MAGCKVLAPSWDAAAGGTWGMTWAARPPCAVAGSAAEAGAADGSRPPVPFPAAQPCWASDASGGACLGGAPGGDTCGAQAPDFRETSRHWLHEQVHASRGGVGTGNFKS